MMADEFERLWLANRAAFAEDVKSALAQRLGTDIKQGVRPLVGRLVAQRPGALT